MNFDSIAEAIKAQYSINVKKVEIFERKDSPNSNSFFVVYNAENRKMLLKMLAWEKFETEVDDLIRGLSELDSNQYKLALPLKNLNGKFHSQINGEYFCLMPFIEHLTILEYGYPWNQALDNLVRFHADVVNIAFPVQSHKTYRSYLERGIGQTQALFPTHEVCQLFKEFLTNRFELIEFREGNIHGDLNSYNLWCTSEKDFYFSDFDMAQRGVLLKDVLDIAAEYLELKVWIAKDVNKFLSKIFPYCTSVAPNLEIGDLKYLIVRPLLPSIFDPDSKLSIEDKNRKLVKISSFLKS